MADCVAVYLTEADRCNRNIVICSGRYNSLPEAQAACPQGGSGSGSGSGSGGGPPTPCCTEGTTAPVTGFVHVGANLDLDVTFGGTPNSRTGYYGETNEGGVYRPGGSLTLQCSAGVWTYALTQDGFGTWPGGVVATGQISNYPFFFEVGPLPANHPDYNGGTGTWNFGTQAICGA